MSLKCLECGRIFETKPLRHGSDNGECFGQIVSKEEILNQPLPENFKKHCSMLDTPKNRGEWAKAIWDFIEAIEEGYCRSWIDERFLKILDDAYDYCEAYGFKKNREQIVSLRIKFKIGEDPITELDVDMNYLRSFFHDEWLKPLDNSWSEPLDESDSLHSTKKKEVEK